jgi:hypothetical protein
MSERLTPQQIRDTAARITGITPSGVVERQKHVQGEAYKINIPEGFLVCLRQTEGWIISLFDKNGNLPTTIYTDIPNERTERFAQFLNFVVKREDGKPISVHFIRGELKSDIERKFFATDVGPVTVHTRGHPLGSEGVIQLTDLGRYLSFIWDRAKGGVDLATLREVSQLPF